MSEGRVIGGGRRQRGVEGSQIEVEARDLGEEGLGLGRWKEGSKGSVGVPIGFGINEKWGRKVERGTGIKISLRKKTEQRKKGDEGRAKGDRIERWK